MTDTADKNKSTVLESLMEMMRKDGMEGLKDAMALLLNESMLAERQSVLGASKPYERSESRTGYANGFKPKVLKTRVGSLELAVPKTRGIEFYPTALEKGCRSERALASAVAEMYINGVSTRRVKKITEELCGTEISASQVSRITSQLDEELEKFRNRKLGCCPYLLLDARYEKVRINGQVVDVALLVAVGINQEGKREILGLSVSNSEAEVHWRKFLESLKERGLCAVELIVSDSHSGMAAARKAVFSGIAWQRCQFHFQQNAQSYVPKVHLREELAGSVRSIFSCQKLADATEQARLVADEWRDRAPKFSAWLSENVEECFSIYALPEILQKKLRTSNLLENTNREIRRRTRLVGIFPNEASLLRLATAVLQEIHDDWSTHHIPVINLNARRNLQHEPKTTNVKNIYRQKVA